MEVRRLKGSCLCGAVQYAVADEFRYALNCHCSQCREEHAHDARCTTCGSLLYSLVRDGRFVQVTMGTLVDNPAIRHYRPAASARRIRMNEPQG